LFLIVVGLIEWIIKVTFWPPPADADQGPISDIEPRPSA